MNRSVCFCNSNRAWGGGEQWHLGAAFGMAKRGCRVFLLAGKDSPLLERAGENTEINTRACGFSNLSFLNLPRIRACGSFFRRNAVSRVITGTPTDLKAAGLAARLAGVPGIYYRRGLAVPVRNTVFNRIAYNNFLTGLIVNSHETERLVFVNNPALMDRSRVHVMYNGIDLAAFDAAFDGAVPSFRREGDTLVIGSAGRLTAQKGQHFLLHMSRALRDADVRHRLILAGEGELLGDLQRLAGTLGIGENVEFAGFLPDMAPFWRSIDCFVLPSLWEGFGYVLAEAQLARRPVVAFDGNSMPEVVRSGETGLLLPLPGADETPADVGARLAAAVRPLTADPERRARLAENGRAFCREAFDQEKRMDDLYALLWPEGAHGG